MLVFEWEYAKLLHKQSKKETLVGDHYGDPNCGLIAPDENWCVTGGEGLILWFRGEAQWIGFRAVDAGDNTNQLQFANAQDRIWLDSFAENRCQFVHDVKLEEAGSVRILLDPWSAYASTWRLDVTTKMLTKLADGPTKQDQPWTDDPIDF